VAPGNWIFTHGGRKATGIDAIDKRGAPDQLGAGELLVPPAWMAMARRRAMTGTDAQNCRQCRRPVIASGGVGNLDHLVEGVTQGPCQRGSGGQHLPLWQTFHCAGAWRAAGGRIAGAGQ
jgi:cyclase